MRLPAVDSKRIFDVVVAGIALCVTLPLLVVLGVAVRLGSRGPAFFRQERVGVHGNTFRIHKFRTMRLIHDGALISIAGDSRVTPIGRILRHSKLDELPQLIDILRGDMSLVGPRPEVPKYVELWTAEQRKIILSVRPGMTDPASILFRHEARELAATVDPEEHYVRSLLPRKTDLYVEYVRRRTFFGDIWLLFRTLAAIAKD
jgi:lipopolysaccharide/colanic/teichoic acid biosynthesis glycosyltransferase